MTAARGKSVLIIDHSTKLAEKIRISGGGKCNFTNINSNYRCYLSQNPEYAISPLSKYTQHHFTELLDMHGINYHEKTLGQLFCDNSAEDIISLLDYLCNSHKVVRKMGVSVANVEHDNTGFVVNSSIGKFSSESLVVATGGLAIPQIGASGFGYNLARQFGHNIVATTPALVPLSLHDKDLAIFAPLSGNSFHSTTTCNKASFTENTLITHRGLSGPAILQISSYLNLGDTLHINMLPDYSIAEELLNNKNSNKLLANYLSQFFTSRLANAVCQATNLNKSIRELNKQDIIKLEQFIHQLAIKPSGTLGYKKAEVTKGGVDTRELSSKTMMSNLVPGLYFIGEVVDITGWLGGYNFQWAL